MRFLNAADFKAEGQPVVVDSMGQQAQYTYNHKTIGNSFQTTREAQQDNLYTTWFPEGAKSLKNSLRYTKNVLAANVLNQAFNPQYVLGDGVSLCSTAHPIAGGTYANMPAGGASVDFSEAALEQAIIAVQAFPAASGMLAQIMSKKIVVPPQLQFAASRLINGSMRTDSANRDISAIYHGDYIPKGYVVNNFLTSASAWFLLTDVDNGFKHFQRTPVETNTFVEPTTNNITSQAIERYSFGCSNARAVYGSPGV